MEFLGAYLVCSCKEDKIYGKNYTELRKIFKFPGVFRRPLANLGYSFDNYRMIHLIIPYKIRQVLSAWIRKIFVSYWNSHQVRVRTISRFINSSIFEEQLLSGITCNFLFTQAFAVLLLYQARSHVLPPHLYTWTYHLKFESPKRVQFDFASGNF